MIEFFKQNLPVIITAVVAVIGAVVLAKLGYEKQAKAIALFLVARAEQEWGGGTGEIKFAAVAEALFEKIPAAKFFLSEKTVSVIIENAVDKLKKYLAEKSA